MHTPRPCRATARGRWRSVRLLAVPRACRCAVGSIRRRPPLGRGAPPAHALSQARDLLAQESILAAEHACTRRDPSELRIAADGALSACPRCPVQVRCGEPSIRAVCGRVQLPPLLIRSGALAAIMPWWMQAQEGRSRVLNAML